MKKILAYLAELSVWLLIAIIVIFIITLGTGFDFENYTIINWIMLVCVFIICLYLPFAKSED